MFGTRPGWGRGSCGGDSIKLYFVLACFTINLVEGGNKTTNSGDQMGSNQMEVYLDEAHKMLDAGLIDEATFDQMREQAMELITAPTL